MNTSQNMDRPMKKILLVDDEESIRKAIKLKKAFFPVKITALLATFFQKDKKEIIV